MVFEQVGMAIFRLKRGNETLEELSKLEVANKNLKGSWWWGWLSMWQWPCAGVTGGPEHQCQSSPLEHPWQGISKAFGAKLKWAMREYKDLGKVRKLSQQCWGGTQEKDRSNALQILKLNNAGKHQEATPGTHSSGMFCISVQMKFVTHLLFHQTTSQ